MHTKYRAVQNFYGENIDEFDEFPAIHQYFPIKIFHLIMYIATNHYDFLVIWLHPK